jgi:hypothetical protein
MRRHKEFLVGWPALGGGCGALVVNDGILVEETMGVGAHSVVNQTGVVVSLRSVDELTCNTRGGKVKLRRVVIV